MKFSLENIFQIRQLIKHLSAGLRRLRFEDNFEGTQIQVVIPAGSELRVRNPLQFLPSSYILLNKTGNSTIIRPSFVNDLSA